jgi:hypothetical protein
MITRTLGRRFRDLGVKILEMNITDERGNSLWKNWRYENENEIRSD